MTEPVSKKAELSSEVKEHFHDDVEYSPWAPFFKATIVEKRSMDEPSVWDMYQGSFSLYLNAQ